MVYGLKICMGDKTHRYYKHTKFRQNLRGDPKFLVDMTWNDLYVKNHPIDTSARFKKLPSTQLAWLTVILQRAQMD